MSSTIRILLTGATGLVGFAILKQALADGHHVTFTARSTEKADTVTSNPAIQKLNPGSRLVSAVVPDVTVDGAFEKAIQGITHVVHVGSPVPKPYFKDLKREIYDPTVRSMELLLQSATNAGTVKRIVITTSFYYYIDKDIRSSHVLRATERRPISEVPANFTDPAQTYILAKRAETQATEAWIKQNNPIFDVYRVPLGWVFGRDDLLWQKREDIKAVQSTNIHVVMAITGVNSEFPLGSLACHLDDVVDVHMGVLLKDLPTDGPKDFGVAQCVDWSKTWEYASRAYPEAAEKKLISEGKIINVPLNCDCSETEQVFDLRFKGYEQMVKDVTGQYLDLLSK